MDKLLKTQARVLTELATHNPRLAHLGARKLHEIQTHLQRVIESERKGLFNSLDVTIEFEQIERKENALMFKLSAWKN